MAESVIYRALRQGPRTRRDRFQLLRTRLWSERSSWDSHWREIADFMLPRRMRLNPSDRNKGDKRNQNVINSTARFSIRTLQSGMHAGMTSPARPWMKLTTPDPELAQWGPVKTWLHDVTQRMLDVFSQTNIYNIFPIVYGDLGVFGTGAMSMLEDDEDLFRCYQYPIGSYAIGLDRRGKATTFVHEYELTVRQVVEEFGVERGYRDIRWRNISTGVKQLWDRGDYEAPVQVTWVVTPNEQRDPERLGSEYLPWASCHYETGTQGDRAAGVFLRESGFRTFPIMVPRWDITGNDSYATDWPAATALGDVKGLQIEEKDKARAIKKMIDPPLTAPTELRTQKTSLLPGDLTYVNLREGVQGVKPIHETRIDLSHLTQDIQEVQYRIQRAFYEDLFLMLANSDPRRGRQPITAREVEERHEEKLIALGPVLDRTKDEMHEPVIDRAYSLMELAGMIPPPPEELEGVKLKVEFTSILAQAQKLVGVAGLDRFVISVTPMVDAAPEVLDKIDFMEVVDEYGSILGVPPKIIREREEAKQRMADRAKHQQGLVEAEQGKTLAQAAQAAGNTPMQGDTALNRLVASGARP